VSETRDDRLMAAAERIEVAAEPALAADAVGLDFSQLADDERKFLREAQRHALLMGLRDVRRAAADGDRQARRWLFDRGLAEKLPHGRPLREAQSEPIGAGVTPHSLRRTFISLLLASGADVPYVMAQAGHADPKMTLSVYAQVIASKTDHGAALDGLVSAPAVDRDTPVLKLR
jgi:integrase